MNKPLQSRILFLALGSAAAIFASNSPAQALTWDWSYSGTDVTANGTFTTTDSPNINGYYTIESITGTRNGDIITGLVPPNQGNSNIFSGNDNLISSSGNPDFDGFNYYVPVTTQTPYGEASVYDNVLPTGNYPVGYYEATGDGTNGTNGRLITFSATVVPFDIPGGATIPSLGSVLALCVLRKVRSFKKA